RHVAGETHRGGIDEGLEARQLDALQAHGCTPPAITGTAPTRVAKPRRVQAPSGSTRWHSAQARSACQARLFDPLNVMGFLRWTRVFRRLGHIGEFGPQAVCARQTKGAECTTGPPWQKRTN